MAQKARGSILPEIKARKLRSRRRAIISAETFLACPLMRKA